MPATSDLPDPPSPNDKDVFTPSSRRAWREWLDQHGDRPHGLWLVYRKKSSSLEGPTYEDLVEESLCFGWIDSQARRVDDDRTMQWFSPRRRGSIWSALNKERIERLEQAGLMTDRGRAAIAHAQADGSFSQTDAVDALVVPSDLEATFEGAPRARTAYRALPDSLKAQALWWIYSAKRPETRMNRVAQTIERLEAGEGSTT